jgi:hypothetical protein
LEGRGQFQLVAVHLFFGKPPASSELLVHPLTAFLNRLARVWNPSCLSGRPIMISGEAISSQEH